MTREHAAIQHKPVVFVVWMKNRRKVKSRGQKSIMWGKCRGNIIMEYTERLGARYEKLSEEAEGLEEWKKYGEEFRGIAEVLYGKMSGKGSSSGDRNQVWWTEEVAKAVGEKKVCNWIGGGRQMQGCCTSMGRRVKQQGEL